METQFYITFMLKTVQGLKTFAKYFIGNDKERAITIFQSLKGTHDVSETNVLFIEFIETKGELPINLDVISCTLNELAENCKIITKELFKSENLRINY
jgi:hypothetical protein